MFETADLTDLPEFGIAHATNEEGGTGCTVFVAKEGATGAVDVRGGGPATRETDLLKPENMIEKIHAVVLSGGSAFGLESACGVMEVLAQNHIGFQVGSACVPIVCEACLFDLLVAENTWPDKKMGAEAATEALANTGKNPERGNVGAGCGATVGKMGLPTQAMKSGFGYCGYRLGELVVVACVAVNAAGNIRNNDGSWLAGPVGAGGTILDPLDALAMAQAAQAQYIPEQTEQQASKTQALQANDGISAKPSTNTTLGVILTNASLSKAQATKVAQITQDAYARAIEPVHTLNDGDTIFVMASGDIDSQTDLVGIMATCAMEDAIYDAVRSAKGAYGLKSAADLGTCN